MVDDDDNFGDARLEFDDQHDNDEQPTR